LNVSGASKGALTRPARGGYSFAAPSRRDRGSRMPAPADPNAVPSPSSVPVDDAEAKRAFREILRWIGEDPERDGLKDTPARMIRAYREYFAGYETDPEEALRTTFTEVDGYDEMIVLRGVTFESHCEHHLAPIVGRAWVGYLPDRRVVGISKLARIVDIYARRLQIQERLTAQIANAIESVLKPRGVAVVVKATHHCMMSRGVRRHGADLVTSRMLGVFRDHPITRSEFLALVDSKSESP
jgi:GTP cyclohydrolase I